MIAIGASMLMMTPTRAMHPEWPCSRGGPTTADSPKSTQHPAENGGVAMGARRRLGDDTLDKSYKPCYVAIRDDRSPTGCYCVTNTYSAFDREGEIFLKETVDDHGSWRLRPLRETHCIHDDDSTTVPGKPWAKVIGINDLIVADVEIFVPTTCPSRLTSVSSAVRWNPRWFQQIGIKMLSHEDLPGWC